MGTWLWQVASGVLDWDEPLLSVFGVTRDEFGGSFEDYLELLHPDDREHTMQTISSSLSTGEDHYVEHRVVRPADGQVRWISGTGRVVPGPDGAPVAMVGVGADITERKLAELRLTFLSRAGELLGSTLDLDRTLQQLCDLAVEQLADWCSVDLLEQGGTVRLVAVAHRDPDKVAYARALRERFGVDQSAEQGLPAVLRTGQPEILPEITEELLRSALQGIDGITAQEVEDFLALGLTASMTVPLTTPAGEVIGGLSLVSAEGRHQYGQDDLDLALEVARRAATAVENARLYEQASYAARTLQRSLLPPELPTSALAELAAYYAPARATDLIGGDFYDAWTTLDGGLCLIVGDVAGKGVDAAALTAACRWTLRSALGRGDTPGQAVEALNDTLLQQGGDRFVTVAVAVLDRLGDAVRLRCSSAGHPRPVLRRRDGTTALLQVSGTLAGLFPGPVAGEIELEMSEGDCLLLYSDGFTEARARGNMFGDEGMLAAAQQPAADAPELVDAVTRAVLAFGEQRDDMALLVARVTGPAFVPPVAGGQALGDVAPAAPEA